LGGTDKRILEIVRVMSAREYPSLIQTVFSVTAEGLVFHAVVGAVNASATVCGMTTTVRIMRRIDQSKLQRENNRLRPEARGTARDMHHVPSPGVMS